MKTNTPKFMVQRRVVTAIVVAHMAFVPAMAFAQQAPVAPTAAPAPQGTVLQLSMKQAEAMALESNLGLKADRLDPDIASENLAAARSAFIPALSTSFSRGNTTRVSNNVFEGTASSLTTKNMSARTSISQNLPWYGGNFSLQWNAGRTESTEQFSRFNPTLNSGINFNFTQPLLEGFKIDSARAGVTTAQRNRSIADLQLEESLVLNRVQVQQAYLSLVGAIEGLKVAQQNLDLARESLRNNKSRVEVGTSAPIIIIQAEAEVARNEEGVIIGEGQLATAEDRLRALILDPARPDYWQIHLEPTDSIQQQAMEVNVEAAIANAIANRTDLIVARRQMENTDLSIEVLRNQVKPSVDLQLNYQASGTGGTQNNYSNEFPPVLLSSSERSLGAVLGDAFRNTNPAWTVGAVASYPIGKSGTEATLARTRLQKQQSQIALRQSEQQVATSVRDAARQVTTGAKRVQVTQVARDAAQRQLDAEQKKFDLGLSSTFELQSRQRDLAAAKTGELRAILDYSLSLIIFEAIQKAPVR